MNGQVATLARVTGVAAAIIMAAILGILVGTALDALVDRDPPHSNAGALVETVDDPSPYRDFVAIPW